MKRITIQDIAQEMHLSRNTVAKALSGGTVSYETKISVLQTASKMGYRKITQEGKDQLERYLKQKGESLDSLRNTQTRAVMVLSGRSQETFWTKVLAGISDRLKERGFRMLLHIVDENDTDASQVKEMIEDDVRGIILLNVFPKSFMDKLSETELPMTLFDAPPDVDEYLGYGDIVYSEGSFAVEKIVKHLIGKGYRKYGYMGYTEGTKSISDRFNGYLSALYKHGIERIPEFEKIEKVKGDYYDYHEVEEIILGMDEYPEVFVCANDLIAKHIATALLKKDPALLKKIVLTGFDNTVEAGFFWQNIITVDVDKEDLGNRLAKAVLDQMGDRLEHALITVRTQALI